MILMNRCEQCVNMLLLSLFFICSLMITVASSQQDSTNETQEEEMEDVRVVVGFNASLPCNVRAHDHDAPILTLWYIADGEAPVYSYDERPGNRGSGWADRKVFGERADYHAHSTPPVLLLAHATVHDGRFYRCRVDFQNTRSRVAWVNLTVIVPPAKMEVVARVTPVKLGDRNDVVCKSYGGTPPPQVLWLQNNKVVDATFTNTGEGTYNVLEVEATRSDLTSTFTCRASNNDRTGPDEQEYLRNVTCGPLSVNIVGEEEPIAEGRTATLTCTVIGSNPPALVTWYQQGHMVKPLHTMVSHRDNVTRSTLLLNASRSDHGRQLVCRAVNTLIPSTALEDTFTLDVQYKPILNLSLGRNLEHDDLREGTDLFFECRIDANPHPYKVEWWHDGDLVTHNVTAGVLVSESTLALQKVRRERSGLYQCRASNVEGDTTSEPLNITIKYAPRCSVSPSLRGVGLLEPLNVSCQVDANPPDVTFSWTFNNSVRREQSEQVNSKRYKTEGLHSVLFYTPMSERDYGTLLCYASNTVGVQKIPCSFTVISAGPPEEVTGCAVDITSHSSTVLCTPGFNGGLPQLFLLQVWKENTPRADELVVNITLTQPEFLVRLLEPGHHYRAEVIAHNARGAAPPVTLYIHTLKQAEMHISLPSRSEPSPLMLVLAVIGGALLVVVMLLVGVWAVRGRRRNSHAHGDNAHIPMKESNPDILEAAPQPQSSAHTISISIIKQPPHSYDGEPSPPLNIAAEDLGMGMGLRTGLSSQKTTFGLSEPLHRPIEKSLQNPVRLPYDDDLPSSPEVSERTQLTPSTIDPCVTLGVEAAVRATRRLPYSRTPVYRDGGSPSCARQPLMLGSSESVM